MVAETNPLFSQQWHFDLIGDIQAIWQDYTGNGVTVGVYDDGTQAIHSDLDGNYDGSLHYSGLGTDDGQPNGPNDSHGTAVAGIIAAENNDEGGVGVAFDASITGVDLLNDIFFQGTAVSNDSLAYMENFDVTNNSWGYSPTYEPYLNLDDPTSVASQEGAGFAHATENGRGGLGTIIVKASGNDAANAQGEGHNSLHTIIAVAATDQNGDATDYTNWGTNILLTAPAAAVTTDLEGSAGYDPGDSTDTFGGTSAATPVVSGVVALMLEANPDLGWRDVQNILALSASHTGSDYGSAGSGFEVGDWYSNGAMNWNGGGMSFHNSYGFGMVDVFAAVRMAEFWSDIHDSAAVTSNEEVVNASYTGGPVPILDHTTSSIPITVTEGIMIEHIYVTIEGTHSYMGDLTIELVAPTGEVFDLFLRELGGTVFNGSWTFGVAAALGMDSAGEWNVRITDSASYDEGTITEVDLEFRGSEATNDTVHHITADFDDYANQEASRRNLADTDGGNDWINMASIADDVSADLTGGGAIRVDGSTWATISGGLFENLVTGDGDDTISGNSGDNILHGARGDDMVEGLRGDDSVYGNEGNDTVYGGDGHDRVSGGIGHDSLMGGDGDDFMLGGTGSDTLRGGDGENDMYSGSGSDRVYGGNDDDVISGASGFDLLVGGGGDDDISGGNHNDTLYGNSGEDTLNGDNGDDWSSGGTGDDLLLGRSGDDTMRGSGDDDRLYGGANNDVLAGNSGDDTLYGGSNNDRLFGGNGNDVLVGDTGSDTLNGGSGVDIFVFNSVFDSPHGSGRDEISDFTHNVDMIDLSGLGTGLSFIGTGSYTNTAGEVRYNDSIGRLYVDIDGNGSSDFSVDINGAPIIDAGDLIL